MAPLRKNLKLVSRILDDCDKLSMQDRDYVIRELVERRLPSQPPTDAPSDQVDSLPPNR